MNSRGRDVLVQAALDGVPQAFGRFRDGDKRCALGVLGESLGILQDFGMCAADVVAIRREFGIGSTMQRVACPECDRSCANEADLIEHLNDDHQLDFLAIARKLPDTTPTDTRAQLDAALTGAMDVLGLGR